MGAPHLVAAAASSSSETTVAAADSVAADQSLSPKSPLADDNEKQTHVRFLVSNTAAGRLIGKGGSTVMELQLQSGAHIQLSLNYECFPSTSDRIVMISGGFNKVMDAMKLILEKLLTEAKEGNDDGSNSGVKFIVPNSSCGGIIGKGGSTIKSFIEDAHAGIKISPRQARVVVFDDRLITVTGSLDEQLRAVFLILSKLTEDVHYLQSKSSLYLYADDFMGLVIGRGGRNLMEISQVTGAKITVSEKGEFMSGTSDSKVTISGPLKSIHMAEAMIMLKIPSNSEG